MVPLRLAQDARVSSLGGRGLIALILVSLIAMLAGCGSAAPTSNVPPPVELSSIAVGPPNTNVPVGLEGHFRATGIFNDGSKQDVSSLVAWQSMNTAVASVANGGVATAVSPGSTEIRASLGRIAGSASLVVTPAILVAIDVTPANRSIASGLTDALRASGVYSDNSVHDITSAVTWSSSNSVVASVSNTAGSSGLTTAQSPGSSTIMASLDGVSGSTMLTVTAATLVSIGVTPTNPAVAKGLTAALKATGVYTDNSTHDLTTAVVWSSATPAVATVANGSGSNGVATTLGVGSTQITATLGNVSGATTLTVTAATLVSIGVTPANPSLAKGLTTQFTAMGTYTDNSVQNLTATAIWSSSDPTVASISNAAGFEGQGAALNPGTVTITATVGTIVGSDGLTVTPATLASIAVTPTNPSIANGLSTQFIATGTYSDNSTQDLTATVAWTSSTATVASVSNAAGFNGLATAASPGSTTIAAASGAVSGSTTLTVTPATLVSIAVTPQNSSIAKGTTQQFTATGTYTDQSTQNLTTAVAWSSTDATLAAVSNAAGSNGLATALGQGSVSIAATLGSVSGATGLTVTPATLVSIAVIPSTPSIANGTNQQFAASGTYTDGSTQPLTTAVTWNSSDTTVAAISNASGSNGLASSVGQGSTTVMATLGSVSGSTLLTVTPAALVSIAVTPATPSITNRTSQQFTATGTYTDNSTQNLTAGVTWNSSDPSVAAISNAAGTNGLAAGSAVGTTSISAALGSIASPSVTLTVTAAPEYVYVTNQNDNTVSEYVIGAGGALNLIGTAATGGEPNAVATDPLGRYVYVANWADGTISEYAVGTDGTLSGIGTIASGTNPASLTVDTTGQYVYVANLGSNTVSQYAIGTGGVLTSLGNVAAAGSPISVRVDPTANYVYVADETGNSVSEYSIGPGGLLTSLGTVATGNDPQFLTVDPTGRYAYAANWNDATISEYTVQSDGTLTPIGTIPTGSCPETVVVDPTGRYVYAENWCSNTVSEYSIGTGGVLNPIGTIPTGNGAWYITIDPSGSNVYVTNFSDNTVSEYTIGTGGALTAIGTVPTGGGPNAITASY
jgi:6-phosphogluconolactonase (cycloisomerase 2 family)/urocanate hydratase